MRYPDIGKLGEYRGELRAALRRRKKSREPRVRVRRGHGEPSLMEVGDRHATEILSLAGSIAAHGRTRGGASNE